MNSNRFATAAFLLTVWALPAHADWDVRRATMSGACSLQPSDSQPKLGVLLTSKPTIVEACKAAVDLSTDDPADTSKCYSYTPSSQALCKEKGVPLPGGANSNR